ncbi:CoA transferase [Candidatus Poriferisodalis sp.]|uniref:CoA transferase n=1 Tax=Candidatus Poriferisodalis sp. TaxID=3101277 RepID=UPI003B01B2AA
MNASTAGCASLRFRSTSGRASASQWTRWSCWPEDVKPLAGVLVVEFTIAWAGPLVCRMLADLGADVIKIEHATARGLAMPPAELREMNPGIVTLDMSGFGATGPDAERISWGPVLDAASGLAFTTGYPDSGPYKQGIAFPDVDGGMHGTVVALAALWQYWRTGEPVAVDLSQLETAIAVAGDQFGEASLRPAGSPLPPRRGARSRDAAPAGVYWCRGEDAWLALTITDHRAWSALAGILRSDLGQHNEVILTELGYGPDEIAALYDSNTIANTPPN